MAQMPDLTPGSDNFGRLLIEQALSPTPWVDEIPHGLAH
jgi:hypothetical protein